MGLPVTVYSSEDAGAPQFAATPSPKPSDYIAILKACLVDGYGTKAPLGWTITAEDVANRKIAFRNSLSDGGTGSYLVVSDLNGTDATNGILRLFACRDFTDFTNFGRRGKYQAVSGNGQQTKWTLIGTGRAFYLFLNNTSKTTYYLSSSSVPAFFAGDIHSVFPNDAGAFITVANWNSNTDTNSAGWNYSFTYIGASQTGAFDNIYDVDGFDHSLGYQTKFAFSTLAMSLPDEPDVNTLLSPLYMILNSITANDRNAVKAINSALSPLVRGWLPGFLQSAYKGFTATQYPLYRTFNNQNHLLLQTYGCGEFWLNLESWYD